MHILYSTLDFFSVRPVIEPFILPNSVHMGQRLSITCTVAQGDASNIAIRWYKDGEIVDTDNSGKFFVRVYHLAEYTSTLLFESVRVEHRGNYTCLAQNDVGEDAHSASMVIYGKFAEWTTNRVFSIFPWKG